MKAITIEWLASATDKDLLKEQERIVKELVLLETQRMIVDTEISIRKRQKYIDGLC